MSAWQFKGLAIEIFGNTYVRIHEKEIDVIIFKDGEIQTWFLNKLVD